MTKLIIYHHCQYFCNLAIKELCTISAGVKRQLLNPKPKNKNLTCSPLKSRLVLCFKKARHFLFWFYPSQYPAHFLTKEYVLLEGKYSGSMPKEGLKCTNIALDN